MDNDKDIEIKREEDLGLDEKIKAGAKAVGRKIGDSQSDIGSEYDTEKTIERVEEEWENILDFVTNNSTNLFYINLTDKNSQL